MAKSLYIGMVYGAVVLSAVFAVVGLTGKEWQKTEANCQNVADATIDKYKTKFGLLGAEITISDDTDSINFNVDYDDTTCAKREVTVDPNAVFGDVNECCKHTDCDDLETAGQGTLILVSVSLLFGVLALIFYTMKVTGKSPDAISAKSVAVGMMFLQGATLLFGGIAWAARAPSHAVLCSFGDFTSVDTTLEVSFILCIVGTVVSWGAAVLGFTMHYK